MRNHPNVSCPSTFASLRPAALQATLVALMLGLVAVAGCGKSEKPASEPAPSEETAARPEVGKSPSASEPAKRLPTPQPPESQPTAKEILQEMVKAYKYTPSYADGGRVRLSAVLEGKPKSDVFPCTVAMVRPNKLRLHCNQAVAICDGETFNGFATSMPGMVLERPAPPLLSLETLLGDVALATSMAQGPTSVYSWLPIQTILLMADDPLNTLLYQVSDTRLLKPAKIDDYDCHRIEITRPDGKGVFWIDRKTFALRRFEYPVELLRVGMQMGTDVDLSLVADFTDAQLAQPVDPNAFAFETPPKAKVVSELVPSSVALLGKRSKDFIFVALDNKPVTLTSLAGKIAVIEFWATWCGPCRETLPHLEQLYERYKDNDKIQFLAVSIDAVSTADGDLQKVFDELGVHVPIYRDSKQYADSAFEIQGIPSTVILGPKGTIQSYQEGGGPMAVDQVAKDVNMLLNGQSPSDAQRKDFDEMTVEYRRLAGEMLRRDLFVSPAAMQEEIPQSTLAEKSDPRAMQLAPLWTCNEIEMPGCLLPVVEPDGQTRLLVIDGGKRIVELNAQGGVVARRGLDLPAEEYVTFLRSARGGDGQRYLVGAAPYMQQVHVYDGQLKRLLSFPDDALTHPHAGIGDVQIADLDGNGSLEICVGYRGVVGVKAVSPRGEILWSERSFGNILKMAVGGPETGGRRLFATNDRIALVTFDGQGKVAGKLDLPGRLLYWVAAADLNQDGQTQLCGLSAPRLGENVAVGLSPSGELLWNYELPKGMPGNSVELVLPAWLGAGQSGQWLMVGADGSLHVVSAEGKPLDRFNYGEMIMGIAFARLDGKPTLLVSTRGKVEAWAVTWPGNAQGD
ncbi:MAG: redoxin domain-containing protein [Pirellulales bacterium]|nr:redoxin domain-containing protein [Pirellulales bacterium]